MTAIRYIDVTITLKYEVDCKVCHAGVETDQDLHTLAEAREAKKRHMDEHADGSWDG